MSPELQVVQHTMSPWHLYDTLLLAMPKSLLLICTYAISILTVGW